MIHAHTSPNEAVSSLPSPSSSFAEQGWNMRPEYNQTNDYRAFYLFIHHFTLIYSCLSIYQLKKKSFPWIVLLKVCMPKYSVRNFQGHHRKKKRLLRFVLPLNALLSHQHLNGYFSSPYLHRPSNPWLSNHLLSYTPPPGRLFMFLSGEELGMTANQHPHMSDHPFK